MSKLVWTINETTDNGVVVTRKKIKRVIVDRPEELGAVVSYESYVDQEHMLAGKKVEELSVTVDLSSLDPEGLLAAAIVLIVQAQEAADAAAAQAARDEENQGV